MISIRKINQLYVTEWRRDSPTNKPAAVPGDVSTVVEFYNASLDHYFITWVAQEISDLDTSVHKAWARTGKSF